MSPRHFIVAACQYPIERLATPLAWEDKLQHWVSEAAHEGAKLVVFPEYASLELAGLHATSARAEDPRVELSSIQPSFERYLEAHSRLAVKYGLHILSASFPERVGTSFRNRARLFTPRGAHAYTEKLQMTRFETELWGIEPGSEARVFATELGALGVTICYDAEFPLLARRQVEAGAQIVLVPSCTDSLRGFQRVRIACQARALENQCYVVQAVTVGRAAWSSALDENHGAAGVYAPPDVGFPETGVIAQGRIDSAQWIYAELDLEAIERVRTEGQVFVHRDFSNRVHHAGQVEIVNLT
ncbi:MAG TPA: carbon-nitrogen hydrolase family protein [Polyangiaceae bacterium]|nr:carbon-nitrogen hydrolase family protein [Polyangiaceae bacterium]